MAPNEIFGVIGVLGIFTLFGVWLGYVAGRLIGSQEVKLRAVKAGAASWCCDPLTGRVVLQWHGKNRDAEDSEEKPCD